MCHVPNCECWKYRGIVRRNVHQKAVREEAADQKAMREESDSLDRDEGVTRDESGFTHTKDDTCSTCGEYTEFCECDHGPTVG